MNCPSCGKATLAHDIRDMSYTYTGQTTVIPEVTGDYCRACDEAILEMGESVRSSALSIGAASNMSLARHLPTRHKGLLLPYL